MKYFYFMLIAIIISGCLPEKEPRAVRVEIAGRVFKVPIGYFDGRAPEGKDTESVLLEYSLPNFEVLPQNKQERQELINAGRLKGMLLESEKNLPSISEVGNNIIKNNKFKKEDGLFYGLEKYIEFPVNIDPTENDDDLFVERNEKGKIISFLRCSPPGKHTNPGCYHRFLDKGLIYDSVTWKISELPNWRAQRDSAIKFIDSLEYKEGK